MTIPDARTHWQLGRSRSWLTLASLLVASTAAAQPSDGLAAAIDTHIETAMAGSPAAGSLQWPLAYGIPELLVPALEPPAPPKP